ncbi:hypothetical protein PCC7424_5651 (plasmid) [Gloeothece citriformis PCC 7424]|uniref:Uncharacterized protein n=1 Tax=Gloeothece citriformis (strain PCC 7424) TaxID=65393 RepID=B7KKS3_GLOC7|nr:hypothetical protein [Gloeothece citriformis]ACK71042.1 hypothetical protein PCC7424_2628 [Gloeothece citriformis PCC 7424]ACK73724.1 hypothetical protein PCC7424_5651 [Gloeothece citriformis PCC 7424]
MVEKTSALDYYNNITKLISTYEQQIKDILELGEVAPPGCWIVRYQARGRKTHYWYYKLHSTEKIFSTRDPDKKTKYKHLGKAGSPAFLEGVASVERRAHIDGLSRAIQTLKSGLMDLSDESEKNHKK